MSIVYSILPDTTMVIADTVTGHATLIAPTDTRSPVPGRAATMAIYKAIAAAEAAGLGPNDQEGKMLAQIQADPNHVVIG